MFKSPLVVGYKGEVGSFLLNGLLKVMPKALDVWCFDINETIGEKLERISRADYIFLCVPLQDTVGWLEFFRKAIGDKIVVEQCSLKSMIYENKKICDLNYISMHLLFRPSATPNEVDRRCAIIDRSNIEFAEILQVMTGAQIAFLDNYEEHDKMMAERQALVHKVILALDETMSGEIDTYISHNIKILARRIREGDRTLYKIIRENKYLDKVMIQFLNNLEKPR